MAEEILTEIHGEMQFQDMNHLASETHQQHVEDEVTINIKKRIQDCGDGDLTEDCCIYRVPIRLRSVNEEAYTPQVVSIGPFHYRNERFQDMERHKQIMFKKFTERAMSSLDDLVSFVRHFEPKVRASYSEIIELTEQELVELTLMDAGFIIELFIMMYERDWKMNKDAILHDLILLENQLPFFVIEEIFNRAFRHDRCSIPSFLTLTCQSFAAITPRSSELNPDIKIKHFTDLFRYFHLQGRMPPPPRLHSISLPFSYNAKALQEAGIKLKASDNVCLLDLKLLGHKLEIPQVSVDSKTEVFFRNMMALEQCYYPYASYITDYAIVLGSLIDTHKDVDLLVQKEIVKNSFGDSNEVVGLFKSLPKYVIQSDFNSDYLDIGKKLNDYCQKPSQMIRALRPYRTLATFAIILTAVQTVISVLQVVLQVVLNK